MLNIETDLSGCRRKRKPKTTARRDRKFCIADKGGWLLGGDSLLRDLFADDPFSSPYVKQRFGVERLGGGWSVKSEVGRKRRKKKRKNTSLSPKKSSGREPTARVRVAACLIGCFSLEEKKEKKERW